MAREREAVSALDKVIRNANEVMALSADATQRAKAFLRRAQAYAEMAALQDEARDRSAQVLPLLLTSHVCTENAVI